MVSAEIIPFYIGTYTNEGQSRGIYRAELDTAGGAIKNCVLAGQIDSPSFLTVDKDGRFVYAVSEAGKEGAVAAFKIDTKTGTLAFLNSRPSGGTSACHVKIDRTGKFVFAANYGSGTVSVMPINPDGSLGQTSCLIRHNSETAADAKTKSPHAHSVNISPDNRFVFVADLGLDKIMVYRLDAQKGILTPNEPAFVQLKPGAGPRHLTFAPNGKYIYAINEIDSTITAFTYDAAIGGLSEIQTISTLPEAFKEWNACAEVRIDPQGKFLYGSNRGHNSIAVYSIDQNNGTLKAVEYETAGIDTPRNFNIDPTGKFCLVANQKTGSMIVFAINPQTGALEPTANRIEISMPVCICFD